MRLTVRPWVFVSALALAAICQSSAAPPQVGINLELSQEFYYSGDSMRLKVRLQNQGPGEIDNPVRIPLLKGFKVTTRDGKPLEAAGDHGQAEPSRPEKLASSSFYGGIIDLAALYPELKEVGSYQIYWSGDGIISEKILVNVIPRYDPSAAYSGTIQTDFGAIEIVFYQKESPIAVKSFVDMAHAGFYSGLQFHEVRSDSFIAGGDSRFSSLPRRPIAFPAEQSSMPLVAGTVVLRPVSAAPPANSSGFMILLRPQPAWTGQLTVVGQVVKGLDVVQKISKVPSSLTNSKPNFRPLKEVTINGVEIASKPRGNGAS